MTKTYHLEEYPFSHRPQSFGPVNALTLVTNWQAGRAGGDKSSPHDKATTCCLRFWKLCAFVPVERNLRNRKVHHAIVIGLQVWQMSGACMCGCVVGNNNKRDVFGPRVTIAITFPFHFIFTIYYYWPESGWLRFGPFDLSLGLSAFDGAPFVSVSSLKR